MTISGIPKYSYIEGVIPWKAYDFYKGKYTAIIECSMKEKSQRDLYSSSIDFGMDTRCTFGINTMRPR